MKISRNHAVAVAHTCEKKNAAKKNTQHWGGKKRNGTFYCNKMNKKKRVRAFTKKKLEIFFLAELALQTGEVL